MSDQEAGQLIPKDFIHLFQDESFLRATFPGKETILGSSGCIGRRRCFGPLCVEYYVTDSQPVLHSFWGLRIVVWVTVTRYDKPSGWIQLPKNKSMMVESFLDIRHDEYWKTWSRTFKNYRNRWERQHEYTIKEVSHDGYQMLYRKWGVPEKLVERFGKRTTRHYILDSESVHFYVLEMTESAVVVAGICCVDSQITHQSYYLSAFTRKDIAPLQAGLWLCNYWVDVCRKKDIQFVNFGVMWRKGDPLDWKGYSDFKMKFNPILLDYPRNFLKITFSLFKNK